jgi:protein-tyrosine phosphatase
MIEEDKYIKYGLKKNYCDEILPNLWLGDYVKACELDDNFDIIINVSALDYKIFPKTIRYDFDIQDHEYVDITKTILKALPIIHEGLKHNKKIFVHCWAGRSRSAAIIIGYMIKYHKMNYNQAFDFICSKRNNYPIEPNKSFVQQLLKFK